MDMKTKKLPDDPTVQKAILFASAAHAGQVRKYTGEPYLEHLLEVGEILHDFDLPFDIVAAGILHDVLEDTKVTPELLGRHFEPHIVAFVKEVTDVSKPEDGDRAVRKAKDLEHLKQASWGGASIKYADLISNTGSIVKHDPDFAEVYLKEKEAILREVRQGDGELRSQAHAVLEQAQRDLTRIKAQKDLKKISEGVVLFFKGGSLWALLDRAWTAKDNGPKTGEYVPFLVRALQGEWITGEINGHGAKIHASWFKHGYQGEINAT
jgi:(p)ppGpp synthase/HD superfamily hydrolase